MEANTDNPDGMVKKGLDLLRLGRLADAAAIFEDALKIEPRQFAANHMLGITQLQAGHSLQGVASLQTAISINPDDAEAFNHLGVGYEQLRKLDDALASYERAISLKPDFAGAYCNRGNVLRGLHRIDDALASYDRAITLVPVYLEALHNRAGLLQDLGRMEEALKSFNEVVALNNQIPYLYGVVLNIRRFLCDWEQNDLMIATLKLKMAQGDKASYPFPALTLIDDPALHYMAAQAWVSGRYPASDVPAVIPQRGRRNKIRIGYYSADYHAHATAYLMAELFELHDRNQFELIAFSFGGESQDETARRVRQSFDQFIVVNTMSDQEVARLSREMGIDIAVDLKGFTRDHRVGIFACRAAPVQVSYLGYPGTMAVDYIDYLIADKTLITADNRKYYTEKIVYLPDSYQPNDRQRRISDRRFTRQDCGLPEGSFVFCCFNSFYKISPEIFDSWMRILGKVDNSVLWLLDENPTAIRNLRNATRAKGIDDRRLCFAHHMDLPDHLARHRLADLFLDTLPYNAHTTCSDALWSGLPVVTQIGSAFAGRVAASLLKAVDLSELIVTCREDYENLAIDLARDPARMSDIKQRLTVHMKELRLFDTPRYVKNLESAYIKMIDNYQSGQSGDIFI